MATSAAIVKGTLPTSGSANFEVAGFGAPSAALIFVSRASTTSEAADAHISVGFWDGTTAVAATANAENAANPADTARLQFDGVGVLFSSDAGVATIGERCSVSNATNGITLTVGGTAPAAAYYATVVLIKGATNAVTGKLSLGNFAGDVSDTSPGFGANLLFVAHVSSAVTINNDVQAGAGLLSFGAAKITDTVQQGCVCWYTEDGSNPTDSGVIVLNDMIAAQFYNGAIDWECSASANANGFTLTRSVSPADDQIIYLALQLPDADDSWVSVESAPTSTGNSTYPGAGTVPFTPQALILAQTCATAVDTATNSGSITIGAADANGQRAHGMRAEYNSSACDAQSYASPDAAIDIRTDNGTVDCAGTVSASSGGWTINVPSNAASSAYKMLAVAIGDSTATAAATSLVPPRPAGRFHHLLVR